MITVRRLYDAGAGGIVDYLLDSVADADPTLRARFEGSSAYYTQAGTPPGRWLGAGLAGLDDGAGLPPGSAVTADQLRALVEAGEDPVTGLPLGRRFAAHVSTADRVRALVSALPAHLSEQERAARTTQIEREVSRTSGSRAVHGFDLTFAPPKSVSVLWALGDQGVRDQVEAAHHDALTHVLATMEATSVRTRLGSRGVVQTETRGVVAAAFDHWDSRAGDPHLHTHLVVANRVQGPDGRWRTLDSRGALVPSLVAMSEAYDNHLMDSLSARLGLRWAVRSVSRTGREHWEVEGVPDALLEAFSTRHADIEDAREQADGPGHWDADDRAWASTRQDKEHRPLAELTRRWRSQAEQATGSPDPLRAVTADQLRAPGLLRGRRVRARTLRADDLSADEVTRLAADVVQALTDSRPSWTTWNVRAEAQRVCRRLRMDSPAQRDQLTETVTRAAVAMSVRVDHAHRAHTPARYRRPDRTSRFVPEHSEIYTAQALIDAEDDLVRLADDTTAPRLDTTAHPLGEQGLSPDQAAAVQAVATSGRRLDLMVGPAGTGKTTTLRALTTAWAAQGGRVTALAPSSAAAEVLGDSLGTAADNVSMWLALRRADAERDRLTDALRRADADLGAGRQVRSVRADLEALDLDLGLRPLARRATARQAVRAHLDRLQAEAPRAPLGDGDLLIIDEASMAPTLPLHDVVTQAEAAGAKVLAVGDPDQLAAVQAGGAFSMLVDHHGDNTPSLAQVHRFNDAWQADASLALRAGDRRAVTAYTDAGAVRSGDLEEVLDQVHSAWRHETEAGLTSLMIASTNETAADLARRAREDLVAAGTVHGRETTLHDGSHASAGDTVVTRRNARHLRTGTHWAHNGATWRVQAVTADGALLVTPTADPAAQALHLPAAYTASQVELAYATTIHRAQGRTVDHAHLVVDPSTGIGREGLYVGMTRGRDTNTAYVVTDSEDATDDLNLLPTTPPRDPAEALEAVLARSTAPLTARRAAETAADQAESVAQLAAEYTTIAAGDAAWGWQAVLPDILPDHAHDLLADAWSDALAKQLDRAAAAGTDVRTLLPALAAHAPLDPDHPAADLARRVQQATRTPPRRLVVGLIPAAPPTADPGTAKALAERERLITARADKVLRTALAAGQSWTTALGTPPTEAAARSRWLRAARTVAAYRDRWEVTVPRPRPGQDYDLGLLEDPLGPPVRSADHVRAEERHRAENALHQAQRLSRAAQDEETRPAPRVGGHALPSHCPGRSQDLTP